MKMLAVLALATATAFVVPGVAGAGENFESELLFVVAEQGEAEYLFAGVVDTDKGACRPDRKVDVQLQQKNGSWVTVDTDKSSDRGAFALIVQDDDVGGLLRGKLYSKRINSGTCSGDVAIPDF